MKGVVQPQHAPTRTKLSTVLKFISVLMHGTLSVSLSTSQEGPTTSECRNLIPSLIPSFSLKVRKASKQEADVEEESQEARRDSTRQSFHRGANRNRRYKKQGFYWSDSNIF